MSIRDMSLESLRNAMLEAEKHELTRLSAQEKRTLDLMLEDCNNAQIAAYMGLAIKTVKNYITNINQKLNFTGFDFREARRYIPTNPLEQRVEALEKRLQALEARP